MNTVSRILQLALGTMLAVSWCVEADEFRVRMEFRGMIELLSNKNGTPTEALFVLPAMETGVFRDDVAPHSARLYFRQADIEEKDIGVPVPECWGDSDVWRYIDLDWKHLEPASVSSTQLTFDRSDISEGYDAGTNGGSLNWLADIDTLLRHPSPLNEDIDDDSYMSTTVPAIRSRVRLRNGEIFTSDVFMNSGKPCQIQLGTTKRVLARSVTASLQASDVFRFAVRDLHYAPAYRIIRFRPAIRGEDVRLYVQHLVSCDKTHDSGAYDFLGHYGLRTNPPRGVVPGECKQNPPPSDNPQCSPAESDYP